MKYLYILTSDDSDFYLEQALLSIISLRMRMSNSFISLLVDDITITNLTGKRSEVLDHVDEVKSVKIDERFNKKARSRWLKTSMRQHITGDFLFIDCDTVIAEDLSDIDNIETNLGAVLDDHANISDWNKTNPNLLIETQAFDKKLGFISSFNSNNYFNGGILLCRDCALGYDFFIEWHRLWLYCFEQGILTDQQSFNQANYLMGNVITELNGKWNCQILVNGAIRYLHDAKVIHYFATQTDETNGKTYLLANYNIVKEIKKTGIVTQELKNLLANPKSLFAPITYLILLDKSTREFNNSAICAAAKRIFHSKAGAGLESVLLWIRKNIFTPLRKKLSK